MIARRRRACPARRAAGFKPAPRSVDPPTAEALVPLWMLDMLVDPMPSPDAGHRRATPAAVRP
jgi:hypothetical protein